jgi:hypothetical protein
MMRMRIFPARHVVEVGGLGTLARSMRAVAYGGHLWRSSENMARARPVIDRVFPFEATLEAYRYQNGGAFGKVVIRI